MLDRKQKPVRVNVKLLSKTTINDRQKADRTTSVFAKAGLDVVIFGYSALVGYCSGLTLLI